MEKIVFLDRDGTLNEEVNYLHRPEAVSYTHLLLFPIKTLWAFTIWNPR